ncbi:hypothetical protein GW17_00047886 [Ensete ventricosum]|nr:hypothetical protein GW17_00047886 [Ensete ventricosum]
MLNERKRPKGTTKEEIQWKDGSPAEELLIDDGRDVEEGIPHPQKHPFADHFPLPRSERELGSVRGGEEQNGSVRGGSVVRL